MSLDVTTPNLRTIVFVKIELEGLTLRYATESTQAMDTDGITYFWEGRVLALSNVSLGFNDFKESNAFVSNISVTLANGKDSLTSGSNLDSYVSSYFWGKRPCSIYVSSNLNQVGGDPQLDTSYFMVGPENYMGPEKNIGPYSYGGLSSPAGLIFKGQIGFPDVFTNYDDVSLTFNVFDVRYQDQKNLNPNTFDYGPITTAIRFPSILNSARGKTAPVIYGDFSREPIIQGFLVDAISETKTIKFADSLQVDAGQKPIHSIQQLRIDGQGVDYTAFSDSAATVTASNAFFDFTRTIGAALKGKTRGDKITSFFGGTSSDLLEHPIEIVFDLLVYYLGYDVTEIDSTSFNLIKTSFSTLKARAYFSSPVSAVDALNKILFEFDINIYFDLGVVKASSTSFANPAITTTLSQDDIVTYSTSTDSNKQYFNSVSVQYLGGSEQLDNFQKRAYHNATKRDLAFAPTWSYDQASVLNRFGRLLYISSLPIREVALKATSKCFLKYPSEFVTFTFHVFTASNLMIRSVSKNVMNLMTDLKLWDLGTFLVKQYAAPGDPTPATLALCQSATYAVYHCDYVISSGYNDTLKTTMGGATTATLTPGAYGTPELLAAEITRAVNAVASLPITCTYSRSTGKFTIATVGASVFTIHWTDTAELGRSSLGFDVSSNSTGAATYTSANICPFDGVTQASMWN